MVVSLTVVFLPLPIPQCHSRHRTIRTQALVIVFLRRIKEAIQISSVVESDFHMCSAKYITSMFRTKTDGIRDAA